MVSPRAECTPYHRRLAAGKQPIPRHRGGSSTSAVDRRRHRVHHNAVARSLGYATLTDELRRDMGRGKLPYHYQPFPEQSWFAAAVDDSE